MHTKGIVEEGNKRAREIGFPTANIKNSANVGLGIFAAIVKVEGRAYNGAAYVGAPQPNVLEVHIIDFSGDLYGKEIEVEVLEKIRDDIHETDNDKLKAMISADVEIINTLLYSPNGTEIKQK